MIRTDARNPAGNPADRQATRPPRPRRPTAREFALACWQQFKATLDVHGDLGPVARATASPPAGWRAEELGYGSPYSLYSTTLAAEAEARGATYTTPGRPVPRLSGSIAQRRARAMIRAAERRQDHDDG